MTRPSRLYKRLGLTGPDAQLVNVRAGTHDLGDEAYSVNISRGGADISSYTASTATVETPQNIGPDQSGTDLLVALHPAAEAAIAAATGELGEDIRWRYRGRVATLTAHDKQRHKGDPAAWRGTTVVGAGWGSLYQNAPDLITPTAGMTLQQAAVQLFQPSWAPFAVLDWNGTTEEWPDPAPDAHSPITAADLLALLSGRLYGLSDTRSGPFRVSALDYIKTDAEVAAVAAWPLARAHVLAPTTWDQPSTYPTEYRIQLLTPTGSIVEIITAPGGIPTGETRIVDQDWSNIVQTTDQWRRIHGLRWETFQTSWRIPSVDVRLDHLIASPHEAHRRAAGMLLRLNICDPVALAGDWPSVLDGIHIVTSLEETITPDAWTLRIGIKDYRALAGDEQFPIKPRTWAQAGSRTWVEAGTATWKDGLPA